MGSGAASLTVETPRHIAIVGGGFSGTLVAVNLARLSPVPLRVTLINAGSPAGRGIAYGTRRAEHLLNVAARNMSALPDHPNHFLAWLRTRTEFADMPETELREMFVPRRIFGDYVCNLALHTLGESAGRTPVATEQIDDEAVAVEPEAARARVHLRAGKPIVADKVVLATGNESPAEILGSDALGGNPAWCPNPWIDWTGQMPPPTVPIVLLGTGLTAVDAIVTLLALDWRGQIVAVSRHGLLPEAHFKGMDYQEFPPPGTDLATLGLDALVRLMERHCARLRELGANPGIAVDKLRPHTQRIWQSFSSQERHEFVARHAARWNVVRHRIAPSIHARVAAALADGRVRVKAAGVERVEAVGGRIRVHLHDRGGAAAFEEGGLVINGTGPHTRFSATRSRLLRQLLAAGWAEPDEMDMGVRVGPDYALIGRGGAPSKILYAIGPLLRGTLWESIAVPELRVQALNIAQTLLVASATNSGATPVPWGTADVIEYAI